MRRNHSTPLQPLSARRRRCAHLRPGLTVIEVVVAVAVLAIITAAVAPTLLSIADQKRIEASAESLDALTDAMSDMRDDNQDWPGRISHLSWPITTSDTNICGATYPSGKVSNWGGPYLDRVVSASGFPIAIGTVSDLLVREVVSGNDGYLKIEVTGVHEDDADALNEYIDDDGSSTAGAVRWGSADAEGFVTLYYLRPIRGC